MKRIASVILIAALIAVGLLPTNQVAHADPPVAPPTTVVGQVLLTADWVNFTIIDITAGMIDANGWAIVPNNLGHWICVGIPGVNPATMPPVPVGDEGQLNCSCAGETHDEEGNEIPCLITVTNCAPGTSCAFRYDGKVCCSGRCQ